MKVWVTKYALTTGITHQEVKRNERRGDYVFTEALGFQSSQSFKLGRDAFEKHGEAFEAAEQMRLKKIASLKKQIAGLEKMKFGRPRKV